MDISFLGLGSMVNYFAFVALNCFTFHEFSFTLFIIFYWTSESKGKRAWNNAFA